jgi:thiazole synthase
LARAPTAFPLGLDPAKIAVERNLEIVPRSPMTQVMVGDGDRLEIVHFIGGGNAPVSVLPGRQSR